MWQHRLKVWASLLSSPQFYYHVASWPWRVVWSYFLVAATVIGLASATYFTQVELPQARAWVAQAVTEVQTYYPANLALSWDGQNLSSSSTEILPIYYPSFFSPWTSDLPERLGYYVPQQGMATELATQLPTSSFFLITPDTLYVSDFQGSWTDLPLALAFADVPPQMVTAETLPQVLSQVSTAAESGLDLLAGIAWLGIPLSIVLTRILSAVVDGLLVYLMLTLLQYRFRYGQIFKMSLLITIIASGAEFISMLLSPNTGVPVFSLVYWGYWLLIVLSGQWHILQLRRQQEPDQSG